MRAYHFVSRNFGLEDIEHRRLKIATLTELNDPFEMLAPACAASDERKVLIETKNELSRRVGLLCFSRDWHNPVQWSHYAEQHKGICLGFDVPAKKVKPVLYRHQRPSFDRTNLSGCRTDAERFALDLLRTKFSHWNYENEVRMFAELTEPDRHSGLYFHQFDEDLCLREVIVGPCSTISRAEMAEAMGELNLQVTVRKARLAFKRFSVVIQNRADMWK